MHSGVSQLLLLCTNNKITIINDLKRLYIKSDYMKSIYLLSISLLLLVTGCSVSKNTMSRGELLQNAKVDTSCFVLYKDGTIKTYNTLELKTRMISPPYLLADGKIKIKKEDVEAYQTEDYYAISQENYSKQPHSKLAIECLPG